MTGPTVSAPGKAFLCGEYAVTEGAPAIIAAVGRRVDAAWKGAGDGHPSGPEASAAFELAQEVFGVAPRLPVLDRRALFSGGTKLGLGSSAAGAVAVAGAVAAYHGHDPADPSVQQRVFECALCGHERVAPNGSGADVAAAAHGGFVAFERRGSMEIQATPIAAPPSLFLSLVWTGTAVRTSELLQQTHRLKSADRPAYDRLMAELHCCAARFVAAFSEGSAASVVEVVREYHDAMRNLGREAGAPIVDATLEVVAHVANQAGGAAKPCGAGGGDVAIAFFDDLDAKRRFEQRCGRTGLACVEVEWGAEGVRRERLS